MNVLFTCAGRRSYLLQYFKEELGEADKIIGADMQLSAPALAFADVKIKVPAVDDSNYVNVILDICKSEKVDLLISLNDLELPVLAPKRAAFEAIGTKLLMSDMAIIDTAFDKLKTVEFAKKIGVNTPKTYSTYNDAVAAIVKGEISFPLVLKPRWGSASIGIEFPKNEAELKLSYQLTKIKLTRSILKNVSAADMDHSILIQEMLPGKEYGVDVLNHFDGTPKAVYIKEKLAMRAGETDKSVLRDIPELEKVGWLIGKELGHIGNIDCDFFWDGNQTFLLEINPRFGGGYPFTHESGGNFVKAIISWLNQEEIGASCFKKEYDVIFSKYDSLIRLS